MLVNRTEGYSHHDPNYPINISNGEGFSIEVSVADAEQIFKDLAFILGHADITTVKLQWLTDALVELQHLRSFRNNLQAENARVAMINQKMSTRIAELEKVLQTK